jgi:hypothetical protein
MLRNYGKRKCPGALRKQPMARGEGPLVTLSTCPRPRPRGPRVDRELYRVRLARLGSMHRTMLAQTTTHYHSHPPRNTVFTVCWSIS